MQDYKEMYYKLFNKLTDVIEDLKAFQCQLEELHINSDIFSDENNE